MPKTKWSPDQLQRTELEQVITVEKLITLYYFEFGKNYSFRGEHHNFWEIVYVDRGEIEVQADDKQHILRQGSIIFHKPNEFHRFDSGCETAPNVIVCSFDCHSEAMEQFSGKVMQINSYERKLLVQMLEEGQYAFEYPFSHPLQRRTSAPIGCEQIFRSCLEMFLISLLRRLNDTTESIVTLSTAARENSEETLVEDICLYINEHLNEDLTVTHICLQFFISRTRLQPLFRNYLGCTIHAHIIKMRIREAKTFIREEMYNLTEISELLGFKSIHYFSKVFKKETGMSPSEYARSIKAKLQQ